MGRYDGDKLRENLGGQVAAEHGEHGGGAWHGPELSGVETELQIQSSDHNDWDYTLSCGSHHKLSTRPGSPAAPITISQR